MPNISELFLYDEPNIPELNLPHLSQFINDIFKIKPIIRDSIINYLDSDDQNEITRQQITNLYRPLSEQSTSTKDDTLPIFYDGFAIQQLLGNILLTNNDIFHLIFTNLLVGTYDYTDYRYHARAVICSNPSVISTTGIVMAPARPREYYMEKQSSSDSSSLNNLEAKYKDSCIQYHDARLSTIVCGYAAQSIFYYITGESFCSDLDCILHNAHWQKDLIYTQLECGKLCVKHNSILKMSVN
ncbi:MAG: DUF6775 family putative metallopeptidase [Candidatus Nitrosoabyssus spongiisocia]|nr:MAG: DUF6775 family putative metallopeptidase [Nitrosopumilaceae archaeon AB1(1)]